MMPSPGWKFSPTDEQLFTHYLNPKTRGHDTEPIVIGEVKFCQFEPGDLPDLCQIKSNVSVWHFFCPLEFKDPGRRVRNRKTRAGFWKPTCKPKPVCAKGTNKQIGLRTTLVFHQGTYKKNIKTNWYTYEYELITKGDLVLCKVELKPSKETSKRQPRKLQKTRKGPVSEHMPSSSLDFEGETSNSLTNNTTLLMNESPCVESEVTDPAISVSVNQMTRELSANSACTEIRPDQVLASGSENIHLGQIVVSSVHGEAEPTHQMDSDIGNQNSDSMKNYHSYGYNSEENHMLFLDFEGESSALSAFNFQSPSVFENISSSTMMEIHSDPSNVSSDCYYDETGGLTASDFEDQDQDNGVFDILDFGNQNQSCDEGEARSVMASYLGNHKRDSNIDMSGFFIKTSSELALDVGDHSNGKNSDIEEGQCSSFRASSLDFEDKNPCKMTEMLTPEGSSCLSYLTDCLPEDDEVEDLSRKINPPPVAEQVAELESLVAEVDPSSNDFGNSKPT